MGKHISKYLKKQPKLGSVLINASLVLLCVNVLRQELPCFCESEVNQRQSQFPRSNSAIVEAIEYGVDSTHRTPQTQLEKTRSLRASVIPNVLDTKSSGDRSNYPSLMVHSLHSEEKTLQLKHSVDIDASDLTAIIHIGPMKTGSSAIQKSFYNVLVDYSTAGRYEDASIVVSHDFPKSQGYPDFGVWNVVGCFRDPKASTDGFIICQPEVLDSVLKIAERKHNVIISAEYLTSPDTNMTAFMDYLKPWKHHRVVAYYRRYYDWLRSFHNQANKKLLTNQRTTMPEYLSQQMSSNFYYNTMYITEALHRWKEYVDDVVVINIHELEDGDVREPFFCTAMITNHSVTTEVESKIPCETFRQKKQLKHLNDKEVSNPSVQFVFEDLVFEALQHFHYWSFEGESTDDETLLKRIKEISKKAQLYHDSLEGYSFPPEAMECPEDKVIDYLLQHSLNSEKELFPDFYTSDRGEVELRRDFQDLVDSKSLCHINARTVLQMELEQYQSAPDKRVWTNFFETMKTS